MKRTLIILTPGFPSNENDSTCLPPQQVFVKALNTLDEDLNIIVLSFQYPFSSMPYYWNGIEVIPFNGRNRGKLKRALVWLKVLRKFRNLHKQNNIIGILSFWCTDCALLGKFLGKVYSIKHQCWILGQDARRENRYVRLIRPTAKELIAMSTFLQNEFHQSHKIRPLYVIPNGLDPKMFPTRPSERDIDIIGVGSLIPLKQFDVFVRVISKIVMEFPSLKTSLVGKGPEEGYLFTMIKKFALGSHMAIIGEKPHNNVLELLSRSKVLLHTSRYEGFSTVCLEALFAGAHVVSFCTPMCGITSHWHIVSNEEDMLEKVLELLHDPNLDQSPQLAFSMVDSAKEVLKLYS